MKKKLLALVLASAMALSLASCGSTGKNSASGSAESTKPTTQNHDTDVLNLNIAPEPQSIDPALN